jgi:uncharacterized protein involved in exopolysaccharide biosynthesis
MGSSRPFPEIANLVLAAGWRRRFLICVPLLLLPLIGLAAALVGKKQYETRMTILVQEPAKLNPFLADLAVGTRLKERIPVLESLARSPFVLGAALAELKLVTPQTPKEQRDALIRRLASSLKIELVEADLVDLRLRGSRSMSLDALLAVIGRQFIEKLVAPERSSIAGSVEFLERQMNERRASLAETERRLAEFKSKHASQLPELHATNFERLANLRQLLKERRTELAGATAAAELRETLGTTNPLVGHLQDAIVRVTGELAMLRARYTDGHSSVQAVMSQLRRLEEERAHALEQAQAVAEDDFDRLWNQAVGTKEQADQPRFLLSQLEQLQAAKARRTTLEKEVKQLEESIAELGAVVANQSNVTTELTAIERDLSTEREVYATLLKRFEMARVTGDLGTFEADQRVMVIQDPDQPSSISPPLVVFVLAGAIGGLAMGLGLAVAAELADETVRRRTDLERIGGLRLLARIPLLPAEALAPATAGQGEAHRWLHKVEAKV